MIRQRCSETYIPDVVHLFLVCTCLLRTSGKVLVLTMLHHARGIRMYYMIKYLA